MMALVGHILSVSQRSRILMKNEFADVFMVLKLQ